MGPSGGLQHKSGARRCSGGRTRTLNNWTRTSRVADYTTPEWVGVHNSRAPAPTRRSDGPTDGARCPTGSRVKGCSARELPGDEVLRRSRGMQRRWPAAVFLGAPAVALLLVAPPDPGAAASPGAVVVRVTPSSGLVDGQTVIISGRGRLHSYPGTH